MQKKESYYYKGNQLKQLRAFCATARQGSMSHAAETLYVSQAAISLQIKALEEALDTRLFERHGPRIQLTRDGQVLLDMAAPLVDSLGTLNDRFRHKTRGQLDAGEVTIAAGESTIIYILPLLVERFKALYPGIHVHLRNVTGRDGLQMIRDDKVDFAIGSMLDVPPDIDYRPLYYFSPMLITAEGHPLAAKEYIELDDLSPYGLILPPRRLTTWRLVERVFQLHKVPYQVALEVGGWEVIKRYVELDFGISIVTSICLREDDALFARDMSLYFPKRSYGLVKRRGKMLSAQAQAFENILDDVHMPASPWQTGHSER